MSESKAEGKADVREEVWTELRKVARPDSRFHYNFAEFIADFEGSPRANDLLAGHEYYKRSKQIFITPDNCLEELRLKALTDGKLVLMTTYGIYRGFWLLDPKTIPAEKYEYASTLDGMEKYGQPITLKQLRESEFKVDFMVTGTGAINYRGIRFGKGHGYFDLEWAMLYTIGAIGSTTPTAAVVHDCQLLDQELHPEIFDTVCDVVATNTKLIQIPDPLAKPVCGVVWDLLADGMLDQIPPLRELYRDRE